jgi:hypothetical protein
LLVVSRFDCGPRPVGHARILHIDGGTDDGIDTNSDGDRGAASDSDRDATAPATGAGGEARGAQHFPVTLGEHQLHAVHDARPERRPL